ncbi:MAG: SRPBCC family protein [Caulobacter sp.]
MNRALLLLVAALLLTPPAALAWAPTGEATATLAAGRPWVSVTVDPAGEAALIRAAIDIPAPPDKVWAAMIDCRNARAMVSNVASCKILSRGAGWDIREHVTQGGALIPAIRNVFRSDYEPYRRIRFHRVDGDLKAMNGEWGLIPLNGGRGTRVTYENHLSVRILAPAALVRAGLRKDTPKVLENLRRIVTGG